VTMLSKQHGRYLNAAGRIFCLWMMAQFLSVKNAASACNLPAMAILKLVLSLSNDNQSSITPPQQTSQGL